MNNKHEMKKKFKLEWIETTNKHEIIIKTERLD